MKRRGVKETDPFDWEKQPAGDNAAVTVTAHAQPPTQPSTLPRQHGGARHGVVTTDNNQENIEPTDNKEVGWVFGGSCSCVFLGGWWGSLLL